MPKFKGKEYVKSMNRIYLDDPVHFLQTIYIDSEQEQLGFRAEKVNQAIKPLANDSGIALEVAYLMVWFMDAGLTIDESLYDEIMKEFKYDEYYDDKVPSFEKKNKYFMHGRVGQIIAQKMFMIGDNEFARAIAYHETLLPDHDHSELEKILFLADKLVPKFENDSHVEVVSLALRESYNSAIRAYLEWYMENAATLQLQVHPYMPRVFKQYSDFTNSLD